MLKIQRLDPSDPVPLYHQVVAIIRNMIESGQLKPGDTFWTEAELIHTLHTSRTTIRSALQKLSQEGHIIMKQGKRTRVALPKISRIYPGLTSFTEAMQERGLKPSSRIVGFNVLSPPPEVKHGLSLRSDEKVVLLKRQMLANDEPFGFHNAYIPLDVWTRLSIEPEYLNNRSLYRTLEEKGGFRIGGADETIEVGYADEETSNHLLIQRGQPVLIVTRAAYSQEHIAVEYTINFYRADRYKYELHHRR